MVKIAECRISAVFQCLLKELTLNVMVFLMHELMWLNHSW